MSNIPRQWHEKRQIRRYNGVIEEGTYVAQIDAYRGHPAYYGFIFGEEEQGLIEWVMEEQIVQSQLTLGL